MTGAWVGFDDMRSLGHGETGSRAALPIWIEYMQAALSHTPPSYFPIPEDIIFVKIDPYNGLIAHPNLTDYQVEIFNRGTEPVEVSKSAGHRPARYIVDDETAD